MAVSTDKKLSVSAARMGRPPIGKFTAVRLSDDTLARIDALVATGKRAEFIREAVENELKRREKS